MGTPTNGLGLPSHFNHGSTVVVFAVVDVLGRTGSSVGFFVVVVVVGFRVGGLIVGQTGSSQKVLDVRHVSDKSITWTFSAFASPGSYRMRITSDSPCQIAYGMVIPQRDR